MTFRLHQISREIGGIATQLLNPKASQCCIILVLLTAGASNQNFVPSFSRNNEG